jgi:Rieske Fe-S protein/cytochrome b subunit of formate dehydrogenase
LVLVLGFLTVFALHYYRRRNSSPSSALPEKEWSTTTVIAFTGLQRAVHWSLALILGLLAISGYEVFFLPNVSEHPFTLSFLLMHEDVSVFLLLVLVIHSVIDTLSARSDGFRSMTMHPRSDLKKIMGRLRVSLGLDQETSKEGKYDVLMRGYHWTLLALLVVLGVTGIYFWDPYNLIPANGLPPSLFSTFLNLHVYSSDLLVGLAIGHIYFSLLPVNRPLLSSMVSGEMDPEYYNRHYDSDLWRPNFVFVKSENLAKLTSQLSPAAFMKITGFEKESLKSLKRVKVPFSAVQKTCGNLYVKDNLARCRAKHGDPCLSNRCPVLGSYVPDYVRINRRRFIRNIAFSAAAIGLLAAGIGSAGLQKPRSPGGGTTPPPTQQVVIANSNTMPPNSWKYFAYAGGYQGILIRLSSGQFEAYSSVCTHQGCTVQYVPSYGEIACPCHGAVFDPATGSVVQGPAFYPLPRIQVTYDESTGNVYLS